MAEFPNFQFIFNKSRGFLHKLDLTAVWPQSLDIELNNLQEETSPWKIESNLAETKVKFEKKAMP